MSIPAARGQAIINRLPSIVVIVEVAVIVAVVIEVVDVFEVVVIVDVVEIVPIIIVVVIVDVVFFVFEVVGFVVGNHSVVVVVETTLAHHGVHLEKSVLSRLPGPFTACQFNTGPSMPEALFGCGDFPEKQGQYTGRPMVVNWKRDHQEPLGPAAHGWRGPGGVCRPGGRRRALGSAV
jgi:hypothetical protein